MKAIKRICEMEAILDKANYLANVPVPITE